MGRCLSLDGLYFAPGVNTRRIEDFKFIGRISTILILSNHWSCRQRHILFSGCRRKHNRSLNIIRMQRREFRNDLVRGISRGKARKHSSQRNPRPLEHRFAPANVRLANYPLAIVIRSFAPCMTPNPSLFPNHNTGSVREGLHPVPTLRRGPSRLLAPQLSNYLPHAILPREVPNERPRSRQNPKIPRATPSRMDLPKKPSPPGKNGTRTSPISPVKSPQPFSNPPNSAPA